MSPNNNTPRLLIRSAFRSSGYSEQEIHELEKALSEIASVQFRRQAIPAAGASFDIEFIVSWIGQAVLSGILGNAVYDGLKLLAEKLGAFFLAKEKASGFPPDTYVLELRFDDLDIRIEGNRPEEGPDCNFLCYETMVRIPQIVDFVLSHAKSEPLSLIERQVIHLYEPHPTASSSDLHGLLFSRPWRIEGSLKMDFIEYFPHEKRLSPS